MTRSILRFLRYRRSKNRRINIIRSIRIEHPRLNRLSGCNHNRRWRNKHSSHLHTRTIRNLRRQRRNTWNNRRRLSKPPIKHGISNRQSSRCDLNLHTRNPKLIIQTHMLNKKIRKSTFQNRLKPNLSCSCRSMRYINNKRLFQDLLIQITLCLSSRSRISFFRPSIRRLTTILTLRKTSIHWEVELDHITYSSKH